MRTSGSDDLPTPMLTAMREMRPWLTFFVVIGYIFGGLVVLSGAKALWSAHGFWENVKAAANLALALIYLLPTMYLSRSRDEIGRVLAGGGMPALTRSIVAQKSFWRTMGITTVFMMGLAVLALGYALVMFTFFAKSMQG